MKTALVSILFCILFIISSLAPVIEQVAHLMGCDYSLILTESDMEIEGESAPVENDKEESEKNEEKEEKEKYDEKQVHPSSLRHASSFLDNTLRTKGNYLQHLYEEIDLTVPTPPPETA